MCVLSLCAHVYYVFVYVCPCAHAFICMCAHACVCVCTGGGKGTGGSSDIFFIFAEQQINNTKRSSQQLKS